MKLRLIEGGAGSGKSRLCLTEIAERLRENPMGAPLILLTPEQATFQAERRLVQFPGVGASLSAQVMGFSVLYRWLAADERLPDLPWLDEQGRAMLLASVVQQKLPELNLLKPAAKNASFVDQLARTLVEFEQCGVLPETLFETVKLLPANDLLAAKLSELTLIYQTYLQRIEGGFRDQGVMMRELAAMVERSDRLSGAELWLDGFMDLNPSQLAVLRGIMRKAKAVNVALCLPDLGAARVFTGQRQLRSQFVRLASELGAEVEVTRLTANYRQAGGSELAAVEVSFAAGQFARVHADIPQQVQLLAASDPREEAECAARLIVMLCRERGYKFRDIAVITRDISPYRRYLTAAFRDFGVPYFLDMGQDVSHHPLVRLIAEALRVVADNWATPSVLTYLKSGLAPVTAAEADVLENYALRVGLRGAMWRQAGNFRRGKPEELSEINAVAARAIAPLLHLQENLNEAADVAAYACALLGFLDDLDAEAVLAAWCARAQAAGELTLAEAHRQIPAKVRLLLSELMDFLGDLPTDARLFGELWQEGVARLTLSSIPPAANQVNVAEISRSRLPEVKAAIVLGLNEGMLPAAAEESSLLGSLDKTRLAALGLELPGGGRERQFLEEYLLYTAFTRSSEILYLLYHEHGADGAAANPSSVAADFKQLFPGLITQPAADAAAPYALGGDRALLDALSRYLAGLKSGEKLDPAADAFWRGVCRKLAAAGKLSAEVAALGRGLSYQADQTKLKPQQVAALYPERNYTSVSRLERFNSCPCRYYAGYGLNLRPRAEFKLQTSDVGSLYHYVLAEVLSRLTEANCDWAQLSEADVLPLVEKAMQDFAAGGLSDIFRDSGKNSYAAEKIRRVSCRALLDTAANLAAGSFRPLALELSFGRWGKNMLAPLVIELSDGARVKLRGQIDRVDIAAGSGADYLRVIDYKMQNKTLTAADIYYGLNWQLPLYLAALLQDAGARGQNVRPAGMFYVPVQEIIKSVRSDDEEGAAVRLQGLAILDAEALTLAERDLEPGHNAKTMTVRLNKDMTYGKGTLGLSPAEYKFVQACLQEEAAEKLAAINRGEVGQLPVAPSGRPVCEYCDYYALCAVDLAVSSRFCPIDKLEKTEVISRFAAKYPAKARQMLTVAEEVPHGVD